MANCLYLLAKNEVWVFLCVGNRIITTIRLYANNDPNNVLWEFAFGVRPIPYVETDELIADDETYGLLVFTPFTEDKDKGSLYVDLEWQVDNGGSVDTTVTHSTDGAHSNILNLNTQLIPMHRRSTPLP